MRFIYLYLFSKGWGREKVYGRRTETVCALAREKNSLYRDEIPISRYTHPKNDTPIIQSLSSSHVSRDVAMCRFDFKPKYQVSNKIVERTRTDLWVRKKTIDFYSFSRMKR